MSAPAATHGDSRSKSYRSAPRAHAQLAKYWTLLGIITSEYRQAVDQTTETLPPSLTRLPGRNLAQRAFVRSIQATTAAAAESTSTNQVTWWYLH